MLSNTLKIGYQIELETMFMEHYKEWCLLSYSYIENMSEAEDMVQDVFVNILKRNSDKEIIDLKNYVSVAVRNTSLKRIKHTKKLEKLKDYSMALSPSHEEHLIDLETRIKVQEAVGILPEKSKKVFELCVLEGAKYQNVADSLGISINTVKFHLKKAFKMLRFTLRDTHFFILIITSIIIY